MARPRAPKNLSEVGESRWLQPQQTAQKRVKDWATPGLTPPWCWACRTSSIIGWWLWDVLRASRAAAAVTLSRRRAGLKINEWMNKWHWAKPRRVYMTHNYQSKYHENERHITCLQVLCFFRDWKTYKKHASLAFKEIKSSSKVHSLNSESLSWIFSITVSLHKISHRHF